MLTVRRPPRSKQALRAWKYYKAIGFKIKYSNCYLLLIQGKPRNSTERNLFSVGRPTWIHLMLVLAEHFVGFSTLCRYQEDFPSRTRLLVDECNLGTIR